MAYEKDSKKQKLLDNLKQHFKLDVKADGHNRSTAVETLKFVDKGDQWDEEVKRRRKLRGRPTMQINTLPKYARQVRGEWLKNCVQIKVTPADSRATVNNARIRAGIIKQIEYLSDAESVYNQNIDMLSKCGYGAWRVRARYTLENPFLQELYLENIDNPLSVFFDRDSRQPNYSDADRVWIKETMPRKEFKERFPDSQAPVPSSIPEDSSVGTSDEMWYDSDTITIAECYYKEKTKKKMVLLSDGQIMEAKEADEHIRGLRETFEKVKADQDAKRQEALTAGQPFDEQPVDDSAVTAIVKERDDVEEIKIKWVLMSGEEFIEEKDWPGTLLPVIMVNGETSNIEGKKYIFGLYKDALDPQRMLNHWHTSAAEFVAMAPKAQWQSTAVMIEGYEARYANANEDNDPVMLYNIDPGSPTSKPERTQPPTVPTAIFTEISRAEQNIKDCIGMYNADVGDQGREISGRAIEARQVPGDTATYIYPKKMSKAIAWTGRILNDVIDKYYDTARDARIRTVGSVGEAESIVPINTPVSKVMQAMKEDPNKYEGIKKQDLSKAASSGGLVNDITVGKYDVIISTGPTFASQRAEAAENMTKLAIANKVSPLDKYLLYKNSDFPGADEAAEIYKKMIPTGLIAPKPGEPPMQPPPPPPQVQVMMAKAQLEMEKVKTERLKLQVQIAKLQNELSQSKDSQSIETISKLNELFSPEHPADTADLGGM